MPLLDVVETVIEGILSSKGEVVVITDAAAYHDADAVKHLVKAYEIVCFR